MQARFCRHLITQNGETALHTAASKGDLITCLKLINRGATFAAKNEVSCV